MSPKLAKRSHEGITNVIQSLGQLGQVSSPINDKLGFSPARKSLKIQSTDRKVGEVDFNVNISQPEVRVPALPFGEQQSSSSSSAVARTSGSSGFRKIVPVSSRSTPFPYPISKNQVENTDRKVEDNQQTMELTIEFLKSQNSEMREVGRNLCYKFESAARLHEEE